MKYNSNGLDRELEKRNEASDQECGPTITNALLSDLLLFIDKAMCSLAHNLVSSQLSKTCFLTVTFQTQTQRLSRSYPY